mmetsp:Transcript_7793/g.14152  ORF Transcript_7793/g.14152 Transcript_7793/m.14152 type:complete len:199 (-) Transcript_7793:93-689(-)|eukprot:CAMPEP_0182442182 /NCGR_PEP_ID=MMETSP1172-20130603/1123_1 /TAXON_ID=708627 /ORGANISM="Timspurckia oligopyrenoides, Strain CCMP3278" /LENGTH=198 /DNA_ID=CAMNT_0024636907 /DNA_START=134 /DNA_END=730 /DNA_ORIENTATION=+
MGGAVSKTYVDKYAARNAKTGKRGILIIGLDGSGKTTVFYQLLLGKFTMTSPTQGHNKELLKYNGKKYDLFDVGGSMLVRETWRLYSRAADAIIFVVDASDAERVPEAADQLKRLFLGDNYDDEAAKSKSTNSYSFDVPVLILANKQDLPGALTDRKVERLLELSSLPITTRTVIQSNAKSGDGIMAGMQWLHQNIPK